MSVMEIVMGILAVLAAVIVLCLAAVWMEKKYQTKEFDERQKVFRGRAYRLSFWTGIIYYAGVVVVLIHQVDGEKTVEPYLLVVMGLLLQAMVMHTYGILTHSALPLSQKSLTMAGAYLFSGTLQLLTFLHHRKQYSVGFVGHSTSAMVFLMTGSCFLYLALLHLIQYVRDRRE